MDTVTVGQAARLINKRGGAHLVAALDEREFAADHIPGSLRLTLCDEDSVDCALHTMRVEPRRRVILYSRDSGPEAYQAAEWLEEAGFGPVHVLAGGLEAWDRAGYAVRSDLEVDRLTMTQDEADERIDLEHAAADRGREHHPIAR